MANKLTKSLAYAANIATSLNEGIYYNGEFDPSYQEGLQLIDYTIFTSSGESAVIAHVDATANSNNNDLCMLSFRGREYGIDKYDNMITGACGELSLFFRGKDVCWDAVLSDMEADMNDIRNSGFTTWVEDEGGNYKCENLNDELAADFRVFDMDELQDGIETCLDTCKSNTGRECPMYFTGHSQGGVYAQMAAVRFKKFLEERNGNHPYLLTFGVPPAFEKGRPCTNALPPSDNIFNFVNIGSYDRASSAVYDSAVSIGLDKNAEHTRAGHLVLMNGMDDNLMVKPNPHDTNHYEIYDNQDYSVGNNVKNRKRVLLHKVGSYKDRVGSIVKATSGEPGQDGFERGTCALNKHSQCNLDAHPDMRCEGHSLETRECTKYCIFKCWKKCKTSKYTFYGCL